jgi:hypothetical protein
MHHNDAPNLDPRTDITDLYIFQNPGDSTKSILILDVNPEAPSMRMLLTLRQVMNSKLIRTAISKPRLPSMCYSRA